MLQAIPLKPSFLIFNNFDIQVTQINLFVVVECLAAIEA